jgi:hypothetical protein
MKQASISPSKELPPKDVPDTVSRMDYQTFWLAENDEEEKNLGMWSPFVQTSEGFLAGRAVVTNIGVFSYLMEDGSLRRELRSPQEVLSAESLASLRMKPLTNEHPDEAVTAENSSKFQVGFLGEGINSDGMRVSAPISVTQKEAISDVLQGRRALSCGYSAEVEDIAGVWMGVQYDAVQRNIRYNHVALVDRGRAGDEARMRFDSAGRILGLLVEAPKNDTVLPKTNLEENRMEKFKFDGAEFSTEAEVVSKMTTLKAKVDQSEAEKVKAVETAEGLQAKVDSAEQAKKEATDKMAKLEAEMPARIDTAVSSRLSLLQSAEKAKVKIDATMSEVDIKKAIIFSAQPKMDKATLEGKSEAYIEARYDSAMEILGEVEEASLENKTDASDLPKDESITITAETKRDAMVKAQQDAWKTKA